MFLHSKEIGKLTKEVHKLRQDVISLRADKQRRYVIAYYDTETGTYKDSVNGEEITEDMLSPDNKEVMVIKLEPVER